MMSIIRKLSAFGVGCLLFTGSFLACDELTGSSEDVVREPAWLQYLEAHPLEVEVPDSVERSAPFEVTFMTYGGGCVAPNSFEVETTVQALEAEIVPYQLRPVLPSDVNCPGASWAKERKVSLRFDQAGQAEVLLRGRRLLPISEGRDTVELALTYQVEVVEGQ